MLCSLCSTFMLWAAESACQATSDIIPSSYANSVSHPHTLCAPLSFSTTSVTGAPGSLMPCLEQTLSRAGSEPVQKCSCNVLSYFFLCPTTRNATSLFKIELYDTPLKQKVVKSCILLHTIMFMLKLSNTHVRGMCCLLFYSITPGSV